MRKSLSDFLYILYQKFFIKSNIGIIARLKWRKGWDSNPRRFYPRWFSRPVPSTARTPFRVKALRFASHTYYICSFLVLAVGLEPTRHCCQRIFVLLYVTIATLLCCSLEHVFTLSFDLGSWCILSTLKILKLYFSHDKFLLMHDNLGINI